jgi:hypothetical protein
MRPGEVSLLDQLANATATALLGVIWKQPFFFVTLLFIY